MNTGYNFLIKDRRLDRFVPNDDEHIIKYPLRATAVPQKPAPVIVGVNWYSAFDRPVKDRDGKWWVAKDGNLGRLRGGHCVCMPHNNTDSYAWYKFYNQGEEGACVGFGTSRGQSLLNRTRYDARWLYKEAQKVDEWVGEDYEGTSVRAAMDILRLVGHKQIGKQPDIKHGIIANRWATNIDQLFEVLQNPLYVKLGAIPFLNSWGLGYPRLVWAPCDVWFRLQREQGEFTIITDR